MDIRATIEAIRQCEARAAYYRERAEQLRSEMTGKKENYVIECVCNALALDRSKVMSSSRKPDYTDARHIIAHHLRGMNYTLQQIGNVFGRDHSTIVHSLAKYQELRAHDPGFQVKALLAEEYLGEKHIGEQKLKIA